MKKQYPSASQPTLRWVSLATLAGILIYALSFEWTTLSGFWAYRGAAVMSSGVIAFVLMTLCMIAALRFSWLEKFWGGLDKMLHLHKWVAISAFVWTVIHWFTERGIKFMAQNQLVAFPPKIRPEGLETEITPVWVQMMQGLEPLAQFFGEYGFYILIVFIVLALVSKIPYHVFQKMHRFIAVIYILFAIHSVVFIPQEWWSTPAAYLILALSLIGSYAALVTLFKTDRQERRYPATVQAIQSSDTGVIELQIKLDHHKQLPFQQGQFAFIDFSPTEGAHPFTITAIHEDTLQFLIKPSGDFTRNMASIIQVGQAVMVEGPYGQFNFKTKQSRQIWVAGGIGIAPFMAQLQALAAQAKQDHNIDFWYSTVNEQENNFPTQLEALCQKANVTLHRVITKKNGYLNAEQIANTVGAGFLPQSSVWFCGPQAFGHSLKTSLNRLGLLKEHFHQEHFRFR